MILPGNDLVDIIDLSLEFGDMVDPSKESNQQGSGHCTKMQAILRLSILGGCHVGTWFNVLVPLTRVDKAITFRWPGSAFCGYLTFLINSRDEAFSIISDIF